jgi:3-oxoacyl-[acyl-carrier-protein] synthase II
MLRRGTHRAAITGGSESMISHINYIGFFLLGAMAPGASPATACKPFDRLRRGTILGEGALTMLLERSEYARPESILAEIAGNVPHGRLRITDPEPLLPPGKGHRAGSGGCRHPPGPIDFAICTAQAPSRRPG